MERGTNRRGVTANRAGHLGRVREGASYGQRRRWLQSVLSFSIGATPALAWSQQPTPKLAGPQAEAATVTAEQNGNLLVRPKLRQPLSGRAKIVIELDGHLKIRGTAESEKPQSLEAKATSTLDYFETVFFDPAANEDSDATTSSVPVASTREYVEATADNWIKGTAAHQELRPECKKTFATEYRGTWQQFCESEPLDVREALLLQSPINSAFLEYLLPVKPAKPSEYWQPSAEELAALFNLEAVHESSLKAHISKVAAGVATIELNGDIQGTANSVSTTLQVKGNCRAEIQQGKVVITWVGLSITEDREISQREPGFAVTARVRLIRKLEKDRSDFSADEIADKLEANDDGRWLVRIKSPAGGFTMLADRRWSVFADSREESILRFVENDNVVAQCNISRLTSLNAGNQVTIEGLQADIRKSLGDRFQEFHETTESVTSSNLRQIRSVALGTVEGVPIQWIYTHLSDDQGNRVALIFTLGGNMAERFAANDIQMTSSFELLDIDQSPTLAAEEELTAAREAPASNK